MTETAITLILNYWKSPKVTKVPEISSLQGVHPRVAGFPGHLEPRQVVLDAVHRLQEHTVTLLRQLRHVLGEVVLLLVAGRRQELAGLGQQERAVLRHAHHVVAQTLRQVLRDHHHVEEVTEVGLARQVDQSGRRQEDDLGVRDRK